MKATDWDTRYSAHELVWGHAPNRFVEAELSDLEPGRALDLGCGEGRNAIWLASRGWQVTAIDFSAVATERARQLASAAGVDRAVEVVTGDVLTGELEGPYDLVLISYLQLPPDEREAVLARAAHLLAPGGTFLLVGHDVRNVSEGHGGPKDPQVHWTVDEVLLGLSPRFEIIRAEIAHRAVEGAPRPALDTLVHARRL